MTLWLAVVVFGLVDCISLEWIAAVELLAVPGRYDVMPTDDIDLPCRCADRPKLSAQRTCLLRLAIFRCERLPVELVFEGVRLEDDCSPLPRKDRLC